MNTKIVLFLSIICVSNLICKSAGEPGLFYPFSPSIPDAANQEKGSPISFTTFQTDANPFQKFSPESFISTNKNDITYIIYKKKRARDLPDDASIKKHYDENKPGMVLLIHGFEQNYTSFFPQEIKNELLKVKEVYSVKNVVVVQWGLLAQTTKPDYRFIALGMAPSQTKIVGLEVFNFIVKLVETKQLNLTNVHIIGYGTGAQIACYAGRLLKGTDGGKNYGKIGRITGLDPVGNFYTFTAPPETYFDKESADYVDVVHTNQNVIGIVGAVGHADFYPNGGGPDQPGCNSSLGDGGPADIALYSGVCSHGKASDYYRMSVTTLFEPNLDIKACPCMFAEVSGACAEKCENPIVFGHFNDMKSSGKYYLSITTE